MVRMPIPMERTEVCSWDTEFTLSLIWIKVILTNVRSGCLWWLGCCPEETGDTERSLRRTLSQQQIHHEGKFQENISFFLSNWYFILKLFPKDPRKMRGSISSRLPSHRKRVKRFKKTSNPLDGCTFVYLDMGSNIGVQIRWELKCDLLWWFEIFQKIVRTR